MTAGTGSVARGINAQGREARVGGRGQQFGDEGSAYWIGREAIWATLAEYDRTGSKMVLTQMLFDFLSVDSAYDLRTRHYSGEFSHDHLAGLSS